mmetsp:Transcript_22732/g.21924  ORF Transcript_22732/g.21924 Transcript_22732/m.21924 type:complete len:110 (-) Transcript_22732:220-549(-)
MVLIDAFILLTLEFLNLQVQGLSVLLDLLDPLDYLIFKDLLPIFKVLDLLNALVLSLGLLRLPSRLLAAEFFRLILLALLDAVVGLHQLERWLSVHLAPSSLLFLRKEN